MNINSSRKILSDAGLFFGEPDEIEDDIDKRLAQTLNMNDTWAWASSYGEYVEDNELPEVARLFYHYGFCGVLYWVSEKNNKLKSEFHDINRFIEFVRNEEKLIKDYPSSSTRAYKKITYKLG